MIYSSGRTAKETLTCVGILIRATFDNINRAR